MASEDRVGSSREEVISAIDELVHNVSERDAREYSVAAMSLLDRVTTQAEHHVMAFVYAATRLMHKMGGTRAQLHAMVDRGWDHSEAYDAKTQQNGKAN